VVVLKLLAARRVLEGARELLGPIELPDVLHGSRHVGEHRGECAGDGRDVCEHLARGAGGLVGGAGDGVLVVLKLAGERGKCCLGCVPGGGVGRSEALEVGDEGVGGVGDTVRRAPYLVGAQVRLVTQRGPCVVDRDLPVPEGGADVFGPGLSLSLLVGG
jgi:hypothetical protein